MKIIKTDVCVIGAGSGGLSVAAGAVQMGAGVVLIEAGKMGGDCLNYGCVPSKSLIAASKAAWSQSHSGAFGVSAVEPQVDYKAVMEHVRGVIETIAPIDSQERFEGLGVHVIREHARFVSESEVEAGETRIKARRFVVATGSRPFVPPIPGLEDVGYLTNETIFDLREQPEHLIVIGGGPIGLELAQAHRRLGSRVTVIEAARALGKDDPEIAAVVLERLREEGVEIVEGASVKHIEAIDRGLKVSTDADSWIGTHLLVAVGRAANVEDLGLDAAGVAYDGKGLKVSDDLRSTNRRVYVVGDAARRLQFTHVAGYHASVVIRPILFGLSARAKQNHIPWVTYTDPEVAHVGMAEADARKKHGHRLTVARFEYAENDRAQTERETVGFIKVMVVGGKPVGASVVGAQAGELISLWSLVIANGLKMKAVTEMVAPYPTLSELNKRVAGTYFSPKLFDNPKLKRVVGLVQRLVP